jgi:hypothetical protein
MPPAAAPQRLQVSDCRKTWDTLDDMGKHAFCTAYQHPAAEKQEVLLNLCGRHFLPVFAQSVYGLCRGVLPPTPEQLNRERYQRMLARWRGTAAKPKPQYFNISGEPQYFDIAVGDLDEVRPPAAWRVRRSLHTAALGTAAVTLGAASGLGAASLSDAWTSARETAAREAARGERAAYLERQRRRLEGEVAKRTRQVEMPPEDPFERNISPVYRPGQMPAYLKIALARNEKSLGRLRRRTPALP